MSRPMKNSGIPWIGEIPVEWKISLLSSLFVEHKHKNEGLKETNLLSLSYGSIIRKDINTNEGLLPHSFDSYNVIDIDDIVFRLTDLQNDKRSLRTGLCKEKGIITSAYTTIRKKSEQIHSGFMHYLFHSYDICKVFYGLGGGVRQGMNYGDLKKIAVVYPFLQEQQRIADYLDKVCGEIDDMVTLQKKMIEELKAYKQSVISEAVTKGLNPNVPMRDSGIDWIGDIPTGWKVCRLKDVGRLYGGLTGKNGDDFNVEDGDDFALFIPFTNVFNNHVIDNTKLNKVKIYEGERQNPVMDGDLLFLMSSEDYDGIGKNSLMKGCILNLYLNSFCKGFRVKDNNVNSSFLNYLLSSQVIRELIRIEAKGFIRINLRQDKLACCPILLPPLPEQRAIADYLDAKCADIDTLIAIKQEKIDSLKEYKKSLIYECITGKKQVN